MPGATPEQASVSAKAPNAYRDFEQPQIDQWTHNCIDEKWDFGEMDDAEQNEFRKMVKRMRKKARLADQLISVNKELRATLRRAEAAGYAPGVEHVPTEQLRTQAATFASFGVKRKDIAYMMGINIATLDRHYGDDIKLGKITGKAKTLETYFSMSWDKDHPNAERAGKKILETQVDGWKEVKRLETDNVNGSAPQIIDSKRLTAEERETLRMLMEKMVADEPQLLEQSVVSEQGPEVNEPGDEPGD